VSDEALKKADWRRRYRAMRGAGFQLQYPNLLTNVVPLPIIQHITVSCFNG